MDFFEVKVTCDAELAEILMAELAAIGFDSFAETSTGFDAYVEENIDFKQGLTEVLAKYASSSPIAYQINEIQKTNWNEEWEKNYHPIYVNDQCLVRASFHSTDMSFPYEIIINPKMSFGTGHHETTWLMLSQQLEIDHTNLSVLDIGCGTGILAVMAAKRGAKQVQAIDIDEWSVENSKENFLLNNCPNIKVHLGKINDNKIEGKFDLVLANINRNVLLEEIPSYVALLNNKGKLVISGFYEQDIADLVKKATDYHLRKLSQIIRNNWSSLSFEKIS